MRWMVMSCVFLGLLTSCGQDTESGGPEGGPQRVERPTFDGRAAMDLVRRQVGFGPRVPGQEGHDRQLEWMTAMLTGLADSLQALPFRFETTGGEGLSLTNLLARFRPSENHRILLLTHWDTRPWADQSVDPAERAMPVPGANDGGSGTAVLLQLARMMSESPPPIGVDLLFVDGEDYGPGVADMFAGSRRFAATLPDSLPWKYGLLLDMVGDRDPLFPMEAYSAEGATQLVQRIWRVAQELGFGGYFPARVGPRVMDDHIPLLEAGLPTVDIIDFEYGPGNRLWHTPRDTPENVSSETLRMVGELVAELVYRGG